MISLKPVPPPIDLDDTFARHAPPRLRLRFRETADAPHGLRKFLTALIAKDQPMERTADGIYIIRDFHALSSVLSVVGGAALPNLISRLKLGIAEGRYDLDDSMVEDIEAVEAQVAEMRRDLHTALGMDALPPVRPRAVR